MFIERFNPQIRRTLVRSRGEVARVENKPERGNPFAERRRRKERRKSQQHIGFRDRRRSMERREKIRARTTQNEEQSKVGQNIDIVV